MSSTFVNQPQHKRIGISTGNECLGDFIYVDAQTVKKSVNANGVLSLWKKLLLGRNTPTQSVSISLSPATALAYDVDREAIFFEVYEGASRNNLYFTKLVPGVVYRDVYAWLLSYEPIRLGEGYFPQNTVAQNTAPVKPTEPRTSSRLRNKNRKPNYRV